MTEYTNCIICNRKDNTILLSVSDRLSTRDVLFNLVECKCGLIFLNPRPDSVDIASYYKLRLKE